MWHGPRRPARPPMPRRDRWRPAARAGWACPSGTAPGSRSTRRSRRGLRAGADLDRRRRVVRCVAGVRELRVEREAPPPRSGSAAARRTPRAPRSPRATGGGPGRPAHREGAIEHDEDDEEVDLLRLRLRARAQASAGPSCRSGRRHRSSRSCCSCPTSRRFPALLPPGVGGVPSSVDRAARAATATTDATRSATATAGANPTRRGLGTVDPAASFPLARPSSDEAPGPPRAIDHLELADDPPESPLPPRPGRPPRAAEST